MEINATFETYVIIDDEEFKVEVSAIGDLVHDGFNHEFGYKPTSYIDGVFITGVHNLETDEAIPFKSLSKKVQKELLQTAEDELNEAEVRERYDDTEYF
jgi:hypothetical protein